MIQIHGLCPFPFRVPFSMKSYPPKPPEPRPQLPIDALQKAFSAFIQKQSRKKSYWAKFASMPIRWVDYLSNPLAVAAGFEDPDDRIRTLILMDKEAFAFRSEMQKIWEVTVF